MQARLYYKSKNLHVGEFKGAFEQAVSAVLGASAQMTVTHRRDTGRAGVTDSIRLDTESLRPVVDLSKVEFTLIAKPSETNSSKLVFLSCITLSGLFHVIADGEESVECLERMALNL